MLSENSFFYPSACGFIVLVGVELYPASHESLRLDLFTRVQQGLQQIGHVGLPDGLAGELPRRVRMCNVRFVEDFDDLSHSLA